MSLKSARAFVAKMGKDEEFKKRILAAPDMKAAMRKAGFDFTEAELHKARQAGKRKLLDGELKAVAGGEENAPINACCTLEDA